MAMLAGAVLTGCNGNQKQTATYVGENEISFVTFAIK